MKLTFKATVYHGTDYKSVDSIIKNGFLEDSCSCATQDKNYAKGFGNALLSFKFPITLFFSINNFREDFNYSLNVLKDCYKKSHMVFIGGYKPKKIKIHKSKNYRFDSVYTPPFRVGKKQGKAVLDSKGLEVVFFTHSEEQAKLYCEYLNNNN